MNFDQTGCLFDNISELFLEIHDKVRHRVSTYPYDYIFNPRSNIDGIYQIHFYLEIFDPISFVRDNTPMKREDREDPQRIFETSFHS